MQNYCLVVTQNGLNQLETAGFAQRSFLNDSWYMRRELRNLYSCPRHLSTAYLKVILKTFGRR